MIAPTPALTRAEAGRVGVTTPFNEQSTHLPYPGAHSLDEGNRGGTFTPYFQQGERLQFSPRSTERNFTPGGVAVNPIYDPEEERSRLERENFDLKMQVYTLEQKVNSLEDELEGDVVQSSDDDGSVDWDTVALKEQTHRARFNGESSHFLNTHQDEILNLRQLLENQSKILKENEARLVSRESVLEQACVAIEQLQVQCSALIEEKLSLENELFSTNSKLHELEQQHTGTIQRINEYSNENLRIKSELEDKARQCIELENLRDQFDEQNLLLEEANVALAELQERDEVDKDKIFELVSREKDLTEQLELEQRRNIELSQQLTLARSNAESFHAEANTSITTLEKTLAEISSYQDEQKNFRDREIIMVQQINDLTLQKQQAENEVKSFQAKLQLCEEQIMKYEKNTLDLQQQLKEQSCIGEDESRQQVEDLHQMLEKMQKEIDFHKSNSENRLYLLEDSERTIVDLRLQIAKKDSDLTDQMKRQNEGLSQLLESAEKDAETYRTQVEEHKILFKEFQAEIQQLEETIASKHNDYLTKEREIEHLLKQSEVTRLEIADYKVELDAKNTSVAHLNDTIDMLQRQLVELKNGVDVSIEEKTKNLTQQLHDAQQDKQALIKDIECHRKTVADYQKASQDLREQLDQKELEAGTLSKQRAKLSAQLKKLEEREKGYQATISERDQLLADSNLKVQLIQQEVEQRSHETITHLQQQIQNSSQQLLSAQRDIKIYQVEVEERDHLLEEAAATIHKLHQQVQGKQFEADEVLQAQLQDKTDQLNAVLKQMGNLKKELSDLNHQLGDTLLLVDHLQQQLKQKDESNTLIQQQCKDLSSELEYARNDINTLRADISARDKLLEDSSKSVMQMRKQVDEKEKENSELLNKIDEISHQLLSARRISETYQRDVEVQSRSLKDAVEKMDDMEKQIQACRSDKYSLQQKIEVFEESIDSNFHLQQSVEVLSKQLASSENLNKSQLEEITRCKLALDDTRAVVEDLRCQLGKYETLHAQASELSLELESEKKRGTMYCDAIEERNKVLEEARSTIQELRTRLEEVHVEADFVKGQQFAAMSGRLEAMQNETDVAKAQNLELWEQISSMEKDLHRYRLDIDERDERLACAHAAVDELQNKCARRDQEEDFFQSKLYDELSQQLEAVQRHANEYQAEVKDCRDELANSHVHVDDLKRQLEHKRLAEELSHMKVEDLFQRLWSLSRASEVYQSEKRELQRQIKSAKNTIEELQEKLELCSENSIKETASNTDDDSRLLFRKDYEYTAAEINERNKLLAEARETINDLKEHLNVLRKEAESASVHNSELSAKLELAEKEVVSSRLQILVNNEKFLILQESVNESQSLLEQKDKAVEAAEFKADALSHQLEEFQRKLENRSVEIKELDGNLTFSNKIIEDLKQQLNFKDQEVESLSEKLNTTNHEVVIIQEELNKRNDRLAAYDSIVQDSRKQNEELKLTCAELTSQLNSLSIENSSLQSKTAEQQSALDDVNGLKNELMAKIKEKESQLEELKSNLKETVAAFTDEKSSLTMSLQKALKRVKELEQLVKLSKDETSKLTKQYVADLDALRIVLNDKEKACSRLKKRAATLSQELGEKDQQLSFTLQTKDDTYKQLKEIKHSFRLLKEENVILHNQLAELRTHVFKPESLKTESSSNGKKTDSMKVTVEEKLEELDLMLEGLTDLISLSKKLTAQVKYSTRGHDDDLRSTIENDCVEFMRANSKLSSYLQNIGVDLRAIYKQFEYPRISSKQGTSVSEFHTYQRPEEEFINENGESRETILSLQSSIPGGNTIRKQSMNIREKKTQPLLQQGLEPFISPPLRPSKNRENPDRFERIQAELDAISERLAKCTTEQKLLSQVMHKGT